MWWPLAITNYEVGEVRCLYFDGKWYLRVLMPSPYPTCKGEKHTMGNDRTFRN